MDANTNNSERKRNGRNGGRMRDFQQKSTRHKTHKEELLFDTIPYDTRWPYSIKF